MLFRSIFRVVVLTYLVVLSPAVWGADPPRSGWTPESILQLKVVSEPTASPDGAGVAFVVAAPNMEGEKSEWLSQIHLSKADGSGAVQLTRGAHSSTAPAFSPDGRWLAFLSARGDGKSPAKNNVFRLSLAGGEAEQLTDEKGGVTAFQWSPDGAQIAFLMPDPKTEDEELAEKEKRDAIVIDENYKRSRLYVVSVEADASGKRPARLLTPGEMHVGGTFSTRHFDWSPDGKTIVFSHQPTPRVDDWQKADISLVEVAGGKITPLTATAAAEGSPVFSPSGRQIAYTVSDEPPTWAFTTRVHLMSPDGKPIRPLAESFDRKPAIVGWSADGNRVLIAETQRTVNRLSALSVDGKPAVDLSPAGLMVVNSALNRYGEYVAFISEAPDRAPEIFLSELPKFDAHQVSHVQPPAAATFGKTEAITWKSTDNLEVEGLLTYPAGYEKGKGRVTLLVVVHGGPTGVFTQSCLAARGPYPVAAFASRGYAVLRCNVRGSSGYGRDFRYANYRDWGGGDYRDIMSGVDALIERGLADPDRLGVMGWSYGGYMTSWIITQTKRFKAASVGAGVTNLMSFTGTADIAGFIPDYMGGEYWNEFDRWRAHSAMFQVKGVSTPTLIQHGDKDLRVPISQGYEFYNALQRQSVPVKMVVYPRQPHSIGEPKLMLDAMQRNLDWFEKYVPPR